MSDSPLTTAGPTDGIAQATGPSLVINAQYLRDLSFENPRAPESLLTQQAGAPDVAIDVDVKARQLGETVFEVVLSLKISASVAEAALFVVEMDYGAVVTIANAPQDLLGLLLVVETPRIIFPFARSIIADATRDGGYPPLMLSPIDFAEIHRQKLARAQMAENTSAEA